MIRIPSKDLPLSAMRALQEYQAIVDAGVDFAEQIKLAKSEFSRRNRTTNEVFREIRTTLTAMCSGAQRCMYCEDSAADEVEHFRPKNLYPQHVFDWENYLYACRPCNRPKSDRFAVLLSDGSMVNVAPKRHEPPRPPAKGDPVLLHPRSENPLQFMTLDIRGGTFLFVPDAPEDSVPYRRASHTIEVLQLNQRDYLWRARKNAYESYYFRMTEYVRLREDGAGVARLAPIVQSILRVGHPTVWAEMRRQRDLIPALTPLFASAPEALSW